MDFKCSPETFHLMFSEPEKVDFHELAWVCVCTLKKKRKTLSLTLLFIQQSKPQLSFDHSRPAERSALLN